MDTKTLPRYHIEYNFDTYNVVRQDTKTHIEIVCSSNKKEWAELILSLLKLRDEAIEANLVSSFELTEE